MSLRTPLGKVKGLGSAKEGVAHWWAQRVTAIALVPLAVWFVINIVRGVHSELFVLSFITSPLNALLTIFFIGAALYHGALGMQVVIEDYVHCKARKLVLLLLVQFVTIFTAAATILAVIALHANSLLLQTMSAGQ